MDLFATVVFGALGATMRWLLSGRQRPLSSFLLEDDPYGNAGFSAVIILLLFLIYKLVSHFWPFS
jgi:hypothetical protein